MNNNWETDGGQLGNSVETAGDKQQLGDRQQLGNSQHEVCICYRNRQKLEDTQQLGTGNKCRQAKLWETGNRWGKYIEIDKRWGTGNSWGQATTVDRQNFGRQAIDGENTCK